MDTQIAAGSLFTSCVTNTEPQGVKDLREAKADYLESLARLRDANAALEKANAAYREAETAYQNALVKLKELEVAKAEAQNKADIAKIEAEAREAAVWAEKGLAEAEAALQKALRDIAVNSKKLTDKESQAVEEYTEAYEDYIEALEGVRQAEADLYNDSVELEKYVLEQQEDSAKYLAQIAEMEEFLKSLPDSGASLEQREAFYQEYFKKSVEADYAKANLEKEWTLYQSDAINPAVKGFATELVDSIVHNAALPAPFMLHYKAQLPNNKQLFYLLQNYVYRDWDGNAISRLDDTEGKSIEVIEKEVLQKRELSLHIGNYVPGIDVVEDVEGKYWLLANFYSAPQARWAIWGDNLIGEDETNVNSLATIVEALSRELVVDSTKFGMDTTGMAAAVTDAIEEYAEIEAALKAGVDAYEEVVDANEDLDEAEAALEEAQTALEEAKADYEADHDSLFSAINNFVNVWNESAGENLHPADSQRVFAAFKEVMAARAKVFPDEEQYYVFYHTDNNDKVVKDSVKFENMDFNKIRRTIRVNNNWRSYYGGIGVDNRGNVQFTDYELEVIFSQAFFRVDKADFIDEHTSFRGGVSLSPFTEEDLREATGYYGQTFYNKYHVFGKSDNTIECGHSNDNPYERASVTEARADVAEATYDVAGAKKDLQDARLDYYVNVYGKYWGFTPEEIYSRVFHSNGFATRGSANESSAREYFDIPEIKLQPEDSLAIVFTPETFTDFREIVKFNYTNWYYESKEQKFYQQGSDVDKSDVMVDNNTELSIVLRELAKNEYGKFEDQKVYFGQLLIAKVLFKEFALAEVSTDTQGTQESLAAIQAICDDLIGEYVAALKKQSDNSKPFYDFVEGLLGKETLEYVFAGLDNALAKAVEFLPAYVNVKEWATKGNIGTVYTSQNSIILSMCYDVINKIAEGKLTSKEALISIFEDFMCREFTITKDSENDWHIEILQPFIGSGSDYLYTIASEGTTIMRKTKNFNRKYLSAYMALQLADAFSGEQFRTLLADVVNSCLNAVGFDLAALDLEDIIEKVLFGSLRTEFSTDFYLNIYQVIFKKGQLATSSIIELCEVVAPSILEYINKDSDGLLSKLDKKYFTEWRTKWAEYDVAMAKYKAQLKAIETADKAYKAYAQEIKDLYDVRNLFQKEIDDATKAYDKACANLEKLYAGVDWKTQAYEGSQDALEAAKLALEAAEYRLAQAKKAYDQVLANHEND